MPRRVRSTSLQAPVLADARRGEGWRSGYRSRTRRRLRRLVARKSRNGRASEPQVETIAACTHPRDQRARASSSVSSIVFPVLRAAAASRRSASASASDSTSSVSSSASRSSTASTTTLGRPCLVITTRRCSVSIPSTTSDKRALASARETCSAAGVTISRTILAPGPAGAPPRRRRDVPGRPCRIPRVGLGEQRLCPAVVRRDTRLKEGGNRIDQVGHTRASGVISQGRSGGGHMGVGHQLDDRRGGVDRCGVPSPGRAGRSRPGGRSLRQLGLHVVLAPLAVRSRGDSRLVRAAPSFRRATSARR